LASTNAGDRSARSSQETSDTLDANTKESSNSLLVNGGGRLEGVAAKGSASVALDTKNTVKFGKEGRKNRE